MRACDFENKKAYCPRRAAWPLGSRSSPRHHRDALAAATKENAMPHDRWIIKQDERIKYVGKLQVSKGDKT